MVDIFISYFHKDKEKAIALSWFLRAKGWSVWWDRYTPGGKRFDTEIEKVLGSANCVVMLWSRKSIESDHVVDEADKGRKRNILVPVQLEKVELPLGFGRRTVIDLSDWKVERPHPGFQLLLEALVTILGPPPVQNDSEISSSSRHNSKVTHAGGVIKNIGKNIFSFQKERKGLFTLAILVLLLFIGLPFVILYGDNSEKKSYPIAAKNNSGSIYAPQDINFDSIPSSANLFLIKNNQTSGPFRTPYKFKASYGETMKWKLELEGYHTRSATLTVGVGESNSYKVPLFKAK